jgi:hypothetical protein
MTYYRLYLRGRHGHVDSFHEFHADDDTAAIATGDELHRERMAELWNLSRLVKEWDGPAVPPTASLSRPSGSALEDLWQRRE